MKSDWNNVSQNDRNAAIQFTKEIVDHFGIEFAKYEVDAKGFGRQMYFNNYLLVLRVENCLVRIVCDREDIYIEVAEPTAPELFRRSLPQNLWFDAGILAAYLDKSERFSWFYEDSDIAVGNPERLESQLSSIAAKMLPYWSTVIEMFGRPDFQQQRDELMQFREKLALASWKALGWNESMFSVQQESAKSDKGSFWSFIDSNAGKSKKIGKVVLGHFPEVVDKAIETHASYLGPSAKMWTTLKNANIRWDITRQFIENGLKAKSTFSFATEVRSAKSYFGREIQYLVSKIKHV